MMRGAVACAGALAWVAMLGDASAQSTLDFPRGETLDVRLDTGRLDNPEDGLKLVYEDTVHVEVAAWLRLHFDVVSLPAGGLLRVTSADDGDSQDLDAEAMAAWSHSTAYFNGDTLIVELFAGPRSAGSRVVIAGLELERRLPGGTDDPCGICGNDDRSPSSEDFSGRLMPVGCSASVYNAESCMVSAGHCMRGGLVAQFRVPQSQPNCYPLNPPAADQFPVRSYRFTNGGVGNDWAVMTTGPNNLGQTAFERYAAMRPLATQLPTSGAADIWGFGVDDTECRLSQTQQYSPGAISSRTSTYYRYSNDVQGGNSGSGFLQNDKIIGVVTHCVVGCGNIATRIDLPAFAAAVEDLCPVLAITCNDIKAHKSKCKGAGVIKGKVVLRTYDFDGRTVTLKIDGTTEVVGEIQGKVAAYNDFYYERGRHTVDITSPPCPGLSKEVRCP